MHKARIRATNPKAMCLPIKPAPEGPFELYLVFRSPEQGEGKLLDLDWVRFNPRIKPVV